ncbi:hypothetical protein [Streptococcus mitis]
MARLELVRTNQQWKLYFRHDFR